MIRILTIAAIIWLEMIRRKDVYVLLILLGAILVTLISLNIFGLGKVVRYIVDVGLLMTLILSWILSINISSRELPIEETRGTIFPLLAKPITRFELILGKWIGSWSVVCAVTLAFYALVIGIVGLYGGKIHPVLVLQGYILHCAALSIVVVTALAFSTRMNHDAAASITYVLTTTAFFLVPRIPEFITHETGFRAYMLTLFYNLLPHFEIFDMRQRIVHESATLDWKTFCMILAYGALLTSSLLLAAWLAYRKKQFIRGNLG
ncbi:ABC transporter permease [Verrucomicrobiota bacterium]